MKNQVGQSSRHGPHPMGAMRISPLSNGGTGGLEPRCAVGMVTMNRTMNATTKKDASRLPS